MPTIINLNKWDRRFIALAEHISAWSKDPSTKCGAVIAKGNRIVSLGFNGFPMRVVDNAVRYDNRELKYQMIIHADINAITFAREPLDNCTIYTWPFPPCCRCATQIIQSGITRVMAPTPSDDIAERWQESLDIARNMYSDACVTLIELPTLNNSTQDKDFNCIHPTNMRLYLEDATWCGFCGMEERGGFWE